MCKADRFAVNLGYAEVTFFILKRKDFFLCVLMKELYFLRKQYSEICKFVFKDFDLLNVHNIILFLAKGDSKNQKHHEYMFKI